MNRTLHEKAEQFEKFLEMMQENGATATGEVPPPEHIEALMDAPLGRADEVRAAHAEGRGPPSFAGGSGNGPPGQSNGSSPGRGN